MAQFNSEIQANYVREVERTLPRYWGLTRVLAPREHLSES